ncbi:MAG: DNRLRE domain-containing protein, partial [Gammaproteobacteria bacterium]
VGGGEFIIYDLRPDSGYARREPELRGDSDIVSMSAPGLDYHPGLRQLVGWGGGKRVFRLDGESLSWSATAHRGGPPQPAMRGTYGRWAYDPDVDAFVVYNDVADNAYTFRPMVARQDTRPPAAPGRPRVESPYQGSALLRWDIPEDDTGVAEFRIYRDGERIAESLDPIFRELGLAAGKRYAYRVSAVDSAGNESARSEEVFIEPPPPAVKLPLGDCTLETRLGGRADVVFCEPWESPRWWQSGYLNDPIVADPRRAGEPDVALTRIVEEGCVAGSCLRIETPRDVTKSLSVYWPLNNAGLAPETLYMRYYLKLGEGWDPFMCRKDGTRVGAGGKFPGPADVRTWADPVKQCGNGGKRGNGIDCWSARSNYRHCASRDGLDCASKPDAIARFGSYLYHARQSGSTGDAGFWDGHGHGSTGGGGKSCESSPHNLVCGRGDGGVLEPERWYRIEIETAMNTPGAADGVIRGWVDGELSYEKTNMVFREPGHDLLHNRLAWLNVYKGGVHGNCSEGAVFLDQLVLAIGEPAGGLDERTLRPPRVDLAALADDADTKGKVTLRWRTEDAASCRASGLWSGEKALAGTEAISVPDAGGEARLVCAGAGGETVRAWAAPGSVRPPGAARRRPSEPLPVPRRASADAPLPPPTGLQSVSQADGAIELRWEPVPGASRYRVALGELLVAVVDAPRFVSSPFPPGAAPRFRVAAVADGGHVSALSAGAPAVDREAGAVPATAADTVARASFAVVSDTYLAASTRSPLGERPAVLVNSRHSTLLAFPFALPPGARVERAALHLTSVYQYADLTLGVFVPAGTWHESRSTYLEADTLLRERWQSAGGDWLDARDQPQGDVPFASADLPKNGHPYEATIDVTALVRRWHADELANTGVFLRALASGGAGQKFASREGDEPAARLVVEYRLPSP